MNFSLDIVFAAEICKFKHSSKEKQDCCNLISCLQLGLQRFHGVCILGFNSAEWFIADIGAILAG